MLWNLFLFVYLLRIDLYRSLHHCILTAKLMALRGVLGIFLHDLLARSIVCLSTNIYVLISTSYIVISLPSWQQLAVKHSRTFNQFTRVLQTSKYSNVRRTASSNLSSPSVQVDLEHLRSWYRYPRYPLVFTWKSRGGQKNFPNYSR